MSIAQLSVYITGAICLLISLPLTALVLLKDPKQKNNQLLALYLFSHSIFIQVVGVLITMASSNAHLSRIFYQATLCINFILPIYSIYTVVYLRLPRQKLFYLLTGLYYLVFTYFFLFQSGSISYPLIWDQNLNYYATNAANIPILSLVLSILGMLLWMFGIIRFGLALRQEKVPIKRNRLRYLTFAPLFSLVGYILVSNKTTHFLPFDMIGGTITTALLTYAIIKHELLDIRVVIRQSLLYSLFVAAITTLFLALGYITSLVSQSNSGYLLSPQSFVVALIVAFVIFILYNNQRRVSRILDEERRLKELDENIIMIASHNLRTPLTAINGYLDMLQSMPGSTDDNARKVITSLAQNVGRLSFTISKFLMVSKLRSDTAMQFANLVELKQLVQKMAATVKPQAEAKGLLFTLKLPELALYCNGDLQQLEMALTILLENAIKYTAKGEIALSLAAANQKASITVTDTGSGIGKADQDKLFQKFSQLGGFKGQYEGLGLGLYIFKSLIENHGGQVGLNSKAKQGSSFWFELPLQQPTPAEPVANH